MVGAEVRSLVLDDPPPARPNQGGNHAAERSGVGERVEQGDGPARGFTPEYPAVQPQVLAHGLEILDMLAEGEVRRCSTGRVSNPTGVHRDEPSHRAVPAPARLVGLKLG